MTDLIRDFRYAARGLARSPRFALAVALTLALAIGPTTALLSLENAMHLLPFPFRDPERVMVVRRTFQGRISNTSYPDFIDLRAGARSFDRVAAFKTVGFTVTGREAPFFVLGGIGTTDFLPLLGVRPALGRAFLPDEAGARVVLVDHRFWLQRLAGDPNVLGRTLVLNREPHVIVGVLAPGFYLFNLLLWVPGPAGPQPELRADRSWGVVGRLKPAVSVEAARADLAAVAGRLEREHPDTNSAWSASLGPVG